VRIPHINLLPARQDEAWLEILIALMTEETGMLGGGGWLGVPAQALSRERRIREGLDPALGLDKGELPENRGLNPSPGLGETKGSLVPGQKPGILDVQEVGLEIAVLDLEIPEEGGILGQVPEQEILDDLGLTAASLGLNLIDEIDGLDPEAEGVETKLKSLL